MSSAEGLRLPGEPLSFSPSRDDFQDSELLAGSADTESSGAALESAAGRGLVSLPRSLTLLNGLALVINLQIGAGIFSAPSVVLSKVASPIVAILAWLLAGGLAWTGASSMIELGTRIPQNGGVQNYLRHCYGDRYGFLFSWAWLLVSRPCSMAMVALVFSEYLFRAALPAQEVSAWVLKATALSAIILVTTLNCVSTSAGTSAANFFLFLKIFGLGSVVVAGLALAITKSMHRGGNAQPKVTDGTEDSWIWMGFGNFTDAVFAALFCYGGWESVGGMLLHLMFVLIYPRLVLWLER